MLVCTQSNPETGCYLQDSRAFNVSLLHSEWNLLVHFPLVALAGQTTGALCFFCLVRTCTVSLRAEIVCISWGWSQPSRYALLEPDAKTTGQSSKQLWIKLRSFTFFKNTLFIIGLMKSNIIPSQLPSEFFNCPVLGSVKIVRGNCTCYVSRSHLWTTADCHGKSRGINRIFFSFCLYMKQSMYLLVLNWMFSEWI